jgi:hypothetical protein
MVMAQYEHIIIKINTKEMYLDRNKMGAWATSIRKLLNELAFDAGDGSWEFTSEGVKIPIYDPDQFGSGTEIGSITIVPVNEDDS